MAILILALVAVSVVPPDGELGRKGNDLYRDGKYREAADAYLAGLEALDESASQTVRAALLNNLGAALYRMEVFDAAQPNFIQSFAAADAPADKGRAAYNAGNTAFRLKNLKAALSFYKQALLANPDNESARFNYEFIARQLGNEDQSPQPQSDNRLDPSEFARQLKEQADQLVLERKYRAAYDLMVDGLKVDETVQAYQTFIGRTGKVADVDQLQIP